MNKKPLILAGSILLIVLALYVFVSFNKTVSNTTTDNGNLTAAASEPAQNSTIAQAQETPQVSPESQVSAEVPPPSEPQQSPSVHPSPVIPQSPSVKPSPTVKKAADVPEGTTPGSKAIDFTLKDLNGKKVSLSDFKGKNVYLNFFATWCPPCRNEMPDIEKFYKEYKDKNLVVVAVNLGEDANTVKSFVSSNKYTFNFLLDSDNSVTGKYKIYNIPVSYFINRDGIIVNSIIGGLDENTMKQNIEALFK